MSYLDITCDGEFVTRYGKTVRLRPGQLKMLSVLLNWRDALCPNRTLDRLMWGEQAQDFVDIDKRRRVYVSVLRNMLVPLGVTVENVHHRGYRLTVDAGLIEAQQARQRHDIQYSFKISAEWKMIVEREATRRGVTESDIMRTALAMFLGMDNVVVKRGGDQRSEVARRGQ